MAPNADTEASAKSASKKKRKSKKKTADKNASVEESGKTSEAQNGAAIDVDEEDDGEEDQVEASRSASVAEPVPEEEAAVKDLAEGLPIRNGTANEQPPPETSSTEDSNSSDITVRLEAAEKERESLRAEVAELRKSLEQVQGKHEEELSSAKEERDEAQAAKEKADSQYQTLLGRVNTIRSQLGERLKADAEELAQARSQIEQLEEKNADLKKARDEKEQSVSQLKSQLDSLKDETSTLRSRSTLSTTNWSKERDDLNSQLAFAREEFENAKQAMQDWEVLAMEERSLRESLGEKVSELEEQTMSSREGYERILNERDVLNSTVDGLQRALQEIQEARKKELRESVESSQTQLDALRKQADEAAKKASEAAAQLETTQKELERALPFEKEVKEKNLLIGKLRHEAVILNDHLTKALRFLKRGKPEDNVDRQIVTNHFLHFLALDRSDPKKFQILQLIAALLGWSDEQREQAGLARPGASNATLRAPLSPFRRTPSTPSLSTDFAGSGTLGGASRESLAELWSDFLEREAETGGGPGAGSQTTSRRGSTAQSQRSISLMSPPPKGEAQGLGVRGPASGVNNHPPVPEES
ncbi:hypothetical protein K461DRAFT_296976 [Myriangium duriaei CBS 260.36]|uniref:GRIP domain-containing protein n=1 Tax=Myriangium duriaei CBS 260.36 TaxID=1168546 RepID=A0A9P4IVG1_9PEZI|nr:hypothetical protein K461DRAFT_296976 [Myriangium duriaei CBS 260.36]